MEETLTYDPEMLTIVICLVVTIYIIAIMIFVGIVRWILRINKIVELLTDQAVFLQDIKRLLEVRRKPQ